MRNILANKRYSVDSLRELPDVKTILRIISAALIKIRYLHEEIVVFIAHDTYIVFRTDEP